MMRSVYRMALLLFVQSTLVSCAYFNTFYNTKKYFREALQENRKRTSDKPTSVERQKFDKTIEQASKVLQLYPNSKYVDDALLILGESFYYMNENRKAERKFNELIEIFPNSALVGEAQLWRAKSQIQLRKYDVARASLDELIRQSKKKEIRYEARFWLGELLWLQKNYAEAAKQFDAAIAKLDDQHLKTRAYLRLGECYTELENHNQAAVWFKNAAKQARNVDLQFDAMLKYARAIRAAGNPQKSVDILKDLIFADPRQKKVSLAKFELANAYKAMQAEEKALQIFNEIIDEHPRTTAAAGSFLELARYDEKVLHNYLAAEENYKKAKAQDPRSEYAREAEVHARNLGRLIELHAGIAAYSAVLSGKPGLTPDEETPAQRRTARKPTAANSKAVTQRTAGNPARNRRTRDLNAPGNRRLSEEVKNKNMRNPGRPAGQRRAARSRVPRINLDPEKLTQTQKDSLRALLEKLKFEMAELFLFRFGLPDSALRNYLDVLSHAKDPETRAFAFYSIAHVYDKFLDRPTVRDSILQILSRNYPQTPQGKMAAQKLGMKVKNLQSDEQISLDIAQRLWLKEQRPEAAVEWLEKTLSETHSRDLRERALYNLGLVYESELHDNARALQYYQKLLEESPNSKFARQVKKKVDFALQARKRAEAPAEDKPAGKKGGSETPESNGPDSDARNSAAADSVRTPEVDVLPRNRKKSAVQNMRRGKNAPANQAKKTGTEKPAKKQKNNRKSDSG